MGSQVKVYLNNKKLSEGIDYNWFNNDFLKFSFGLGQFSIIQVIVPGKFNHEFSPGKLNIGELVKVQGLANVMNFSSNQKVENSSSEVTIKTIVATVKSPVKDYSIAGSTTRPELRYKNIAVYLDYIALKEGKEYVWLDSKHIKILIPANYKHSVVSVAIKNKKNQYFDVGRQRSNFVIAIKYND